MGLSLDKVTAAVVVASVVAFPCVALAEADYSFLDNMTESELYALQTEVGDRLNSMASEPGEANEAVETAISDKEITFRGIPWKTAKAQADVLLEADGLHRESREEHDVYRPSKISYGGVIRAGENVDNGGVECFYNDVPVAGFTANATICYMYPIDDAGNIVASDGEAQLYLARYIFRFDDPLSAYDDIKSKLDGIYGDNSVTSDGDVHDAKANTWKDKDGNWVRLSLYDDYDEYTYTGYVLLIYSASGAEQDLDAVEAAVQHQKVDAENEIREMSRNDTSGL